MAICSRNKNTINKHNNENYTLFNSFEGTEELPASRIYFVFIVFKLQLSKVFTCRAFLKTLRDYHFCWLDVKE